MVDIASQLAQLRQKHEFTVIQLTDLKEDYEKIKKINNTIMENLLTKSSDDTLHEIKLIIDGTFHNQKIIQLQAQIDRLNAFMNEEVEKRVKQIRDKFNLQKECLHCKQLEEDVKIKHKLLGEKREQFEEAKGDFDKLVFKKRGMDQKSLQLTKRNEKLEQKNKRLENMMKNMIHIKEANSNLHALNQEWENKYENLLQQYEKVVEELDKFHDKKQNRENMMKKKIKNLIGEINTKKNQKSNYIATSRLTQQSDYSEFSIKDAINRPQTMFF